MLDALRFVAPAVAKKDYIPALTHYRIKSERITGFNGIISLSSDIDVDLDIYPNAAMLLAAIRACSDTITLNMTPGGKLAVKSGKFRSFVECLDEDPAVFVEPDGDEVEVGEHFLAGIKKLAPVMGVDASRPWAMGIRASRQSLFATNNAVLAEYWTGTDFPFDVVIPAVAVEELLRINQNPTKVQVTQGSISFWFGETRWLRSSLIESHLWPDDHVSRILSAISGSKQSEFAAGLFDAIDKLKPFLQESGTLYLSATGVSTSKHDGEGSSIDLEMPEIEQMQAYHQKNLALLGEVADTIDWSTYPKPCMFAGERLRGAIVGQKVDV